MTYINKKYNSRYRELYIYIYIYLFVFAICHILFCVHIFSFLHYPVSPGGCLKASWGLWLRIHKLWARGEPWRPRWYRKLLEKIPLVALIFWKHHDLGVDFVIYGAGKARDPARVVDGVEVCRQNHKFSENDLRKVPIVKTSSDFVPKLTF